MFEALRAAYEEQRRRPPPLPQSRPSNVPSTMDVPIHYEADEPSLVADVAFGENHAEEVERERLRTREVIEGISGAADVKIASEALNKG
jgi:hypothetical protein